MNEVTRRKLLIIEDNRALKQEFATYFSNKNNMVFTAETLHDAYDIYEKEKFWDAVILDLILPDGTGLSFFDILKNPAPPVIILSDLGRDEDILTGFEAGATDYIAKPCSARVLETRLAMRLLPRAEANIAIGDLTINANTRVVKYKEQHISLTSSEFNILFFLMQNAGVFFTSDEIYEKVWNAISLQSKTVRKHISALRQKLKEVDSDKTIILTDFGRAYCFAKEGNGHEHD